MFEPRHPSLKVVIRKSIHMQNKTYLKVGVDDRHQDKAQSLRTPPFGALEFLEEGIDVISILSQRLTW